MMVLDILEGVLEQGLIYAIMAVGVYISYSILDFPDLSVDGTFPLGAAVTAALIIAGVNPWLCCLIAFASGIVAGLATGIIHVKFHVKDLLSGILVMTGLYSLNMRIAGNRSNLPLLDEPNIFNTSFLPKVVIILLCAVAVKLLLDWYLRTKNGFLLRAAGDNPQLVTSLAKNVGTVKIIGLALANGFVALSGSIMCQYRRGFEISMGTGSIVIALASVIIGISLFKNVKFMKATSMVVIGAVLYNLCISVALAIGVPAGDLKLLMALLFLAVLIINGRFKKRGGGHA